MNVLVLGSGGREHALCWRLQQDPSCSLVFAWPGNSGMEGVSLLQTTFNKKNLKEIIELYNIKLVIPGAEKFLYEGVSDWCDEWRIACFGPSTKAAGLERSKIFAKKIMTLSGIPTASYEDLTPSFENDLAECEKVLASFSRPVIKISGPSLGKGVFVCNDAKEALIILKDIKKTSLPGLEEGIMVEEGLKGKEVSLFYACNGENFVFLGAAQDHKRLLDNDEGPNTGGMGAYSPVSWANDAFIQMCSDTFLKPTLKKMKELDHPFKGVLFLGLMVNEDKVNLLEYNVRFGDPETQVILPLIQGDLTRLLFEIASGKSLTQQIDLHKQVAIHVVKAARGYPGTFGTPIEKNQKISVEKNDRVYCFFAGVTKKGEDLFTNGGRVLGVTALGASLVEARELVYKGLSYSSFEGEQFRQDIGGKA